MNPVNVRMGFEEALEWFNPSPKPPDSIPLRILGFTTMPTTRDEVQAAFRRRMFECHPDVGAYSAIPGANEAVEAIAMNTADVQEAKWARDVLLTKIRPTPKPGSVTADAVPTWDHIKRHACKGCDGERLNRLGKPLRILDYWTSGGGHRLRWGGYCTACAHDKELERQRERRARARADHRCAGCAELFTPDRRGAIYCSAACRQKAYRARRRAA